MNDELVFVKRKLENTKQDNEKLKHEVKDLRSVNKNLQKDLRFSSKKMTDLRSENKLMSDQILLAGDTITSKDLQEYLSQKTDRSNGKNVRNSNASKRSATRNAAKEKEVE